MSEDRMQLAVCLWVAILTICLPGLIWSIIGWIKGKGTNFYSNVSVAFYGLFIVILVLMLLTELFRNIIF